ncbi:MAG: 3-methyladenine DNA glycosylase AlkD, partial [Ulvibacter sp.]
KKAVNWALRSIGKRNVDLNKQAIAVAKEILKIESKTAHWIAKDAIKELEGERVNILDYPRAIYRP